MNEIPLHQMWDEILSLIKARVSAPVFASWFETLHASTFDGSILVVEVPSKFAKDWIEPRYLPLIAGAASASAGHDVEVAFEVGDEVPTVTNLSEAERERPGEERSLNARYTFDS